MEEQKSALSEFAVASLVMGIVSFVQILNVEKALVAIIFGMLALKRIKISQLRGKKFAVIGIILGISSVVLTTIVTIKFLPQLMQMRQQMSQQPVK